jgi:hypothetical protein
MPRRTPAAASVAGTLLAAWLGACAAGGAGSGEDGQDASPGDAFATGGEGGAAESSALPDTSAPVEDTGSTVDAPLVDTSTPAADTGGGGQPDSGGCSITSTAACANGAQCCIMSGAAVCMCTVGTGTQGTACMPNQDCAPGFVCAIPNGSTNGTCLAWCVYPSGPCPGATHCQELFMPPPTAGGLTYGECM